MNRQDFPILSREVYGRPLIYLDNAATTQKPRCVVEAISEEYYNVNANVHRGVHYLSQQATELHEGARETVRRFINAPDTAEIIFTRGTTESLNLVATSYGEAFLHEGDEVLISEMEHHSDIVPWQLLRERKGIVIKVIPMTDDGILDLQAYERLFTSRTRLVCCCHVSNVLGTVNPVKEMAAIAHAHGAHFLVDAAQSVPHQAVDVQHLGCDFLVFSGHKVYGPTGIGVLWGRKELLDAMPPYQGGGEMIARVTWEKTTYERLPFKFEAGTPDYVGSHALAVALDYVSAIGMDAIQRHEADLTAYALHQMRQIEGMRIYGHPATLQNHAATTHLQAATPPSQAAMIGGPHPTTAPSLPTGPISFNVGTIHPLDLGTLLDRLGIAIRTGHHCAQPLMARCGVEGMARISFGLYNTREDVDAFISALQRVIKMF